MAKAGKPNQVTAVLAKTDNEKPYTLLGGEQTGQTALRSNGYGTLGLKMCVPEDLAIPFPDKLEYTRQRTLQESS